MSRSMTLTNRSNLDNIENESEEMERLEQQLEEDQSDDSSDHVEDRYATKVKKSLSQPVFKVPIPRSKQPPPALSTSKFLKGNTVEKEELVMTQVARQVASKAARQSLEISDLAQQNRGGSQKMRGEKPFLGKR